MERSGHVDTFVADRLAAPAAQPEYRWDHPDLQYGPRVNCGAELLDAMVERGFGDRRCLRDGDGHELTYHETLVLANQAANTLIDHYGLVPGNRVLLRGPNNPWLAVCWLAVQKAGLVAVATMPMLRAGELAVVIDKAQIDLCLVDTRFTDELAAGIAISADQSIPLATYGEASDLAELMNAAPAEFANCDTASTDVSLVAFTSGTTGQPKGCVHSHRDVLAIADTFSKHIIKPHAADVFVGSPPLAFTFGLGGLLVFPLRVGACALLLESAPPRVLLEAVEKHRATVVVTAPTAYRVMLDSIANFDISSWRIAVSAGEALPLATRRAVEDATGFKMIDGLGATEMLHVFISASGADVRDGAIGRPVPGFVATIVDDDGNEVPPGVVGRLAVKGPTGCRYLDDPRQESYVQHGWNITGDAMHRDADGYFWYAARADDMIISAGYNIAGPEVEAALLTHPGVAECACVGVTDPARGMVVKAFVVVSGAQPATPEFAVELQDHVKRTLAPYKYPRLVEFRSELPKTATGKLMRFKLRSDE